jgi:hypothetical protein
MSAHAALAMKRALRRVDCVAQSIVVDARPESAIDNLPLGIRELFE